MADDESLAAAIVADWRQAALGAADRALCAFAERLTTAPWWVTRADVEALRAAGLSDAAVHDAVQVIGYFNYINRVADGLGTDLEPDMPPRPELWRPPPFVCPQPASLDAVTLEAVTPENLRGVLTLEVSPPQRWFVATNPVSLAQAHVQGGMSTFAICADATPVGFAMLETQDGGATQYLVRLMVDHRAQGHGFGRRAMQLLIERARATPGVRRMTLSYVPGDGSPLPFYLGLGFAETGEVEEGERVMALELGSPGPDASTPPA